MTNIAKNQHPKKSPIFRRSVNILVRMVSRQKKPHVRIFTPTILGPDIATPILWAPSIVASFCWKPPMPMKSLVLGGGVGGGGGYTWAKRVDLSFLWCFACQHMGTVLLSPSFTSIWGTWKGAWQWHFSMLSFPASEYLGTPKHCKTRENAKWQIDPVLVLIIFLWAWGSFWQGDKRQSAVFCRFLRRSAVFCLGTPWQTASLWEYPSAHNQQDTNGGVLQCKWEAHCDTNGRSTDNISLSSERSGTKSTAIQIWRHIAIQIGGVLRYFLLRSSDGWVFWHSSDFEINARGNSQTSSSQNVHRRFWPLSFRVLIVNLRGPFLPWTSRGLRRRPKDAHKICPNFQEPLNAPFLNGLFSSGFSRGKSAP